MGGPRQFWDERRQWYIWERISAGRVRKVVGMLGGLDCVWRISDGLECWCW